jgi:hypothetical protein
LIRPITPQFPAALSRNSNSSGPGAEPINKPGAQAPNWILRCSIAAGILLPLGVVAYLWIPELVSDWRGDPVTKNQLKRIALAYWSFGDAYKDKAPTKLQDLHPFMHAQAWPPDDGDQKAYGAVQNGRYTVVWGVKDFHKAKEGSKLLLVYETEAKKTTGFAIFADHRIERLTPEQLEKAIRETPTE